MKINSESKLSDMNGVPVRFFHGAKNNADIKEFSISHSEMGSEERGIYFSNDPKHANSYAVGFDEEDSHENGVIYPVNLISKNPYICSIEDWNNNKGLSPTEARKIGHDIYLIFGQEDSVTAIAFDQQNIRFSMNDKLNSNALTVRAYHGSKSKINGDFLSSPKGTLGSGIYFAGDIEAAKEYSDTESGFVYAVDLKFNNPWKVSLQWDSEASEKLGIDTPFADEIQKTPWSKELIKQMTLDENSHIDSFLKEQLIAMGHDGIIGTYHDGSREIVAFNNDQITLKEVISNKQEQAYSVPNNADYVVMHNLTESNLLEADKLGGLPVPSLAISLADSPIDGYGEISLIAPYSMANPSRKNPVFDADVYSPRFPTVICEYEKKGYAKFKDMLYELSEKSGVMLGPISQFESDLKYNRIDSAVETLMFKPGLLIGWLKDRKGINIEVPYNIQRKDIPPAKGSSIVHYEPLKSMCLKNDPGQIKFNEPNKEWAEAIYSSYLNKNVEENPEEDIDDIVVRARKNLSKFIDIDTDKDEKEVIYPSEIKSLNNRGVGLIFDAWRNSIETKSKPEQSFSETKTIDHQKLFEIIKKLPEISEFKSEMAMQIESLISGKKLLKDNGKKTAFTTENIVKEMTRTIRDGESFSYQGVGQIRSHGAKKLSKFDHVVDRSFTIQESSIVEKAKKKNQTDVSELERRLYQYLPEHINFSSDALFNLMIDSFKIGISSAFLNSYYKTAPESFYDEVLKLRNQIIDSPTEYFEIKPQRLVDLNEFIGAVVPRTASPKTIEILEKKGLKVFIYDKIADPYGNVGRMKAVSEFSKELHAKNGLTRFSGSHNASSHEIKAQKSMMNSKSAKDFLVDTCFSKTNPKMKATLS